VKVTKNECYFKRYGCGLCRNKARLSVSQIFVTVTKSFFLQVGSVVLFLATDRPITR